MRINCSDTPYSNRKLNPTTIVLDNDKSMSAILFTCRPGRSPVAIPVNTPRIQKSTTRRSGSMIFTLLDIALFHAFHYKYQAYI